MVARRDVTAMNLGPRAAPRALLPALHVPTARGLSAIALFAAATIAAGLWLGRARRRRAWHARDIVDVAAEESFPASDPPPWTSGR